MVGERGCVETVSFDCPLAQNPKYSSSCSEVIDGSSDATASAAAASLERRRWSGFCTKIERGRES